jgi:crotonobetaine/carnitine-CoA ligase
MPDPNRHPPWFNPEMPRSEDCVLSSLLEKRAAAESERHLVLFEDGSVWTAGDTLEQTRCAAAALRALGVTAGDRVLAWLPNGPSLLRAWFASNYLGATLVPINTAYRGKLLAHVINLSKARLLIAHSELLPRLADIETGALTTVIRCRTSKPIAVDEKPAALNYLDESVLLNGDPSSLSAAPVQPWDSMMIIYTSGTTGPSKGVINTYLQQYTVGQVCFGYLTSGDRMLVNLPLFHVGGTTAIMGALATGASIAVYESFSTARFWEQIRESGATAISGLLGAMVAFLDKNPPQPGDAENPLKRVVLSPVTRQSFRLAERYGFDYFSGFNMTEVSVPLVSTLNTCVQSSCGRPRSGIECQLVDSNDIPVPEGQVGELVIRSDLPWSMTPGYIGMAEATARAWRNGWFHTGDLMTRDAEGNYFFIDREKDAIRRRGENISSIEVEAEVAEFAAVTEVAAYAVPSSDGEDEVMIAVAPAEGALLQPQALIEYLQPRMTHFMLPRYVRVLPALPRTPTNKVQKHQLREEGITADTWDREAAGIPVKRESLAVISTIIEKRKSDDLR